MDLTQNAPGIGSTWAGGEDGMDVTAVLLSQIDVSQSSISLRLPLLGFEADGSPSIPFNRIFFRQ